MNLFYRTICVHSCAIILITIIDISVYSKHIRHKRVYGGVEVDSKFPYIVFLKSIVRPEPTNAPLRCSEKLCTGTLIHPRFVLTLTTCVQSSSFNVNASDIKVFLKYRPYINVKANMTFNVGLKVISKSTSDTDDTAPYNVALLLMNDSFSQINSYPKILPMEPMPEGTKLKCSTVGFSMFGRNISYPIIEPIKPLTYEIEGQLNISYCSTEGLNKNIYICDVGAKSSSQTLCENGDEGSPLLCESHLKDGGPPKSMRTKYKTGVLRYLKYNRFRSERVDNSDGSNDGMFVYGIADVVRGKARCVDTNSTMREDRNMYLYMLRYSAWISAILDDFDEKEQDEAEVNSTLTLSPITESEAVTSNIITTTTTLPEYYDTDDYINTIKRPFRCKGGATADRRLIANFHRSSYIVRDKDSPLDQDNDGKPLVAVAASGRVVGPSVPVVVTAAVLCCLCPPFYISYVFLFQNHRVGHYTHVRILL